MTEKIKTTFGIVTVKIALGAVILCFISLFMPWLTEGRLSMTLIQAFQEKPSYFAGMPALLAVGLLWVAAFFLLNFPKLTLVGDVPLLVVWLGLMVTASDYGLTLGIGSYLYLILVIVCIVMAFMTKKIKKDGGANKAGN